MSWNTARNGHKHLYEMATLMYWNLVSFPGWWGSGDETNWNCTVSEVTKSSLKGVTSNYIYIYNYSCTLCCKLLCYNLIYTALRFIVLVDWLNLWTHINITCTVDYTSKVGEKQFSDVRKRRASQKSPRSNFAVVGLQDWLAHHTSQLQVCMCDSPR